MDRSQFEDIYEYFKDYVVQYADKLYQKNFGKASENIQADPLLKWGIDMVRFNNSYMKNGKEVRPLKQLLEDFIDNSGLIPASGSELAQRFNSNKWVYGAWYEAIVEVIYNGKAPNTSFIGKVWLNRVRDYESTFKSRHANAVKRDEEYQKAKMLEQNKTFYN